MSSLLVEEAIAMYEEWKSNKSSNVLRKAREKYVKQNPMLMKEIDDEIENYRSEKREWKI